jgi:DHA1 family bicyclomycin/chloramphenicol resistance-like MFS transporter
MLMALAPAVAPGLGGLMLLVLPWASIFVFLAGYGIVMIILVRRFLPETLPERQSLHPVAIGRNYGKLLVDPFYLLVTLASALVYAGLMAYLSSSSFVYIEMLGVPVEYFGFVFVTAVAGYMAGSAISARLAARYESEQLLLMGSSASLAASLIMLAGSSLLPGSVLVLMLPMMIYSTGLGLVLPHGMAIALRPFPLIAATASALLGFIQMSLSAAASGLVGLFLQQSPTPMLWAMVLINATALVLALRVYQRHRAIRH